LQCTTFSLQEVQREGFTLQAIDFARAAGCVSAIAGVEDFGLICFSNLRWKSVHRTQHPMSRFARDRRVIFWEEPVVGERDEATLEVSSCTETGVIVVTPQLPGNLPDRDREAKLKSLLEIYLAGQQVPLVRWYCTPAMLPFSRNIDAVCTVYDRPECPSAFHLGPRWVELERDLIEIADLVFTGAGDAEDTRQFATEDHRFYPSRVALVPCGAGATQ
jgi:UDP-galactopyranose mutase